jgi:hypothetical protein
MVRVSTNQLKNYALVFRNQQANKQPSFKVVKFDHFKTIVVVREDRNLGVDNQKTFAYF